jgi:hypothetical protein
MQTIAMNLARTTGMSLGDATIAVGKAYQGSGAKLLTSLGITKKGIKGQEALNALFKKTKGAAGAYADSVAGSFESLKIGASELKEQFGKAFLPAVAKLFKGLNPYVERLSHLIQANTPKLQKWADIIVNKILDKLPSLFAEFEANVPKALISIEKFVDSVSGIGKEADKLLGPGGSITTLVSGIGLAFGGIKGSITANLVKNGLDPFTALIVGNIAGTAIPNALAEVFTKVVVTKAIAAFGTSIAGASAAGAAASAAGTAGAAAGGGGLLALLGAAALPVTIVALSAAAVAAIAAGSKGKTMAQLAAESGNAPRPGRTSTTYNGPAIGPLPGAPGSFTPFAGITPMPGAPMIGATSTTAYNIFIGTGKVDTVISDSFDRMKRQGRNP